MSDSSSDFGTAAPAASPRRAGGSWIGRLGGVVFSQLLALLVFVGVPAAVTAIAPVSRIHLERQAGQVSARTSSCLLFVIPFRVQTIAPVTGFDQRHVSGTVSAHSRRTNRDDVKSEDQAWLVVVSQDQRIEVPVSPADMPPVRKQAEEFLSNPQATELKLFVVANWKFSVIGGGLVSLLTVIYAGTIAIGLLLKLVHLVQWLCGVPPHRRLLAAALKTPPPR